VTGSPRVLAAAALASAIVALTIVLAGGGDDQRRVRVDLPSAAGLRDGSDVRVAGATIGTVDSLDLGPHDVVHANLVLKSGDPGVGPGATATVKANNLLGEKYVQLTRGGAPVRAGQTVTISGSRVRLPVDLDEVLDVLDAPTRARLAILINQAGIALTGRKVDLNRMLAVAPRSFDRATSLLTALNTDNAAIGRLVDQTDRFLATLTPARRDVGRFVDTAGKALETLAQRRQDLRATLDRAPATLRNARSLLAELRRAAEPLGPAARLATSAAPALTDTLAEVQPFTAAAAPTLRKATAVAPALTRLSRDATPVVRRAVAPLGELRDVSRAAPPLTNSLRDGIDGLLAALEGWSRAIQGRDSVGHVFRGHLGFGAEAVQSLMRKLAPPAPKKRAKKDRRPAKPALPKLPLPDRPPGTPTTPKILEKPQQAVKDVVKAVTDLLSPNTSQPPKPAGERGTTALLDYLLGG